MATQEIPSGNGIKDISVPRSSAYIKIAKKNGSRLLPGRSILSIANSIPSILGKAMRASSTQKGNRKREGEGGWEREGE